MNKLRNKLYKYEFITMILGVILFIVELKFATNYPSACKRVDIAIIEYFHLRSDFYCVDFDCFGDDQCD